MRRMISRLLVAGCLVLVLLYHLVTNAYMASMLLGTEGDIMILGMRAHASLYIDLILIILIALLFLLLILVN